MTAAAIPSPSNWTTAGPSCQAASATFWCGASPLPQLDPGRSSDRGFSSGQRSTLPDPFVNAPPCADDDVNNLPLHPYFFNRTRGTTIGVDQLSNLGASPRTTRLFRLRQLPPIAFEPIVMPGCYSFRLHEYQRRLQPCQIMYRPIQNNRSRLFTFGRGTLRLNTASCWRSAAFSNATCF
jgi:hypothetical protein